MIKQLSIFTLLIIFCFGCTNHKESNSLKKNIAKSTYVNSVTLKCDSIVWSPRIVGFFRDCIFTRLYSSDYIFYTYQVKGNEIKTNNAFGKSGSGPNEIMNNAEIHYDEKKKLFYIFDILGSTASYYTLVIDSVKELSNMEKWKKHNLSNESKYVWTKFIPIADNLFIGLGGSIDNDNLLCEVNLQTGTIKDVRLKFPNDGVEAKNIVKRYVYNDGNLLKRPSSNQYLYYCTNWGNYAEIITLDEQNNFKSRKTIADNYPIYKTNADGINRESLPENLMGIKAYTTEDYIYLLPNFKNKKEYLQWANNGFPADYNNQIFLFDWNGRFIKTYILSKPIIHFIVDSKDKFLIGISLSLDTDEYSFEKYAFE